MVLLMNEDDIKVLFVDDEAPFLDLVRRMFKNENYEILTAVNGEEAINVFKENTPSP